MRARQFRHGVGAEGEPKAAGANLRIESSVGVRSDALKARRSAAARRHPGEKAAGRWRMERRRRGGGALARGEGEAVVRRVEVSVAVGERALIL
jgi:hypothetical protein